MKREWACALWAVACLASAEEKTVPSYGNDDLVRLAPLRGQTGVLSEPAVRSGAEAAERPDKGQGEGYWRGEAERVNAGLQKLRSAATATRTRLDAARAAARDAAFKAAHAGAKASARGGSGSMTAHETRIAALESELRALEDTIRLRQDEFEERARRARALPGWIR